LAILQKIAKKVKFTLEKKKQKIPIFANFFGKKFNKSYTFCMDPK
jgi:hypothetical protein